MIYKFKTDFDYKNAHKFLIGVTKLGGNKRIGYAGNNITFFLEKDLIEAHVFNSEGKEKLFVEKMPIGYNLNNFCKTLLPFGYDPFKNGLVY